MIPGIISGGQTAGGGGGGTPGPIPDFRASGTIVASNSLGASVSPPLPSGTASGDILILLTECNSADTVPAPSGYLEVASSPQSDASGSTSKLQVFWKRAGGSEASPTVTRVGDHTCALVLGFTGCVTSGNPVNASSGSSGATSSVSIPDLTTTIDNCLIVDCVAHGTDSSVGNRLSDWANASLADPVITEAAGSDVASSSGGGGGFAAAYGGKADSGTVSATTATLSPAISWGGIKIALQPVLI